MMKLNSLLPLLLAGALTAPAATWTFTDAPASTDGVTLTWTADDAPGATCTATLGGFGLGWLAADPIAPEDTGLLDCDGQTELTVATLGGAVTVTLRRYWDWDIFDAGPTVAVNGQLAECVAVEFSEPVNGLGARWATETWRVAVPPGVARVVIRPPETLPWTVVLDRVSVTVETPAPALRKLQSARTEVQ